jgi:hypothetical protein
MPDDDNLRSRLFAGAEDPTISAVDPRAPAAAEVDAAGPAPPQRYPRPDAIAGRAFPAGGAALAGYQQALGRLLVKRESFGEAESLLLAAHQAHLQAYGSDNLRTDDTAAALVGLYEAWSKHDEAARYRKG